MSKTLLQKAKEVNVLFGRKMRNINDEDLELVTALLEGDVTPKQVTVAKNFDKGGATIPAYVYSVLSNYHQTEKIEINRK